MFINRKQISLNYRKYLFFIFFLLISTGLWLANRLGQDYMVELQLYPKLYNSSLAATYTDIQKNTLYIYVKGTGFNILNRKLVRSKFVNIDVKDIPIPENGILHLPTYQIRDKFVDFENFEIISIVPDTIYYTISSTLLKKVPLRAELDLAFAYEYQQSGPIELYPDSVTISGSKTDLDKISYYDLKLSKHEQIYSSIEGVEILHSTPNLVVHPQKIRYKVPVDRCTEAEVSLDILPEGFPANISLLTFPSKVKLKYIVPIQYYKKVNANDFKVVVNYQEALSCINHYISLKLVEKPKEALNIQLDPEYVEFLIEKK